MDEVFVLAFFSLPLALPSHWPCASKNSEKKKIGMEFSIKNPNTALKSKTKKWVFRSLSAPAHHGKTENRMKWNNESPMNNPQMEKREKSSGYIGKCSSWCVCVSAARTISFTLPSVRLIFAQLILSERIDHINAASSGKKLLVGSRSMKNWMNDILGAFTSGACSMNCTRRMTYVRSPTHSWTSAHTHIHIADMCGTHCACDPSSSVSVCVFALPRTHAENSQTQYPPTHSLEQCAICQTEGKCSRAHTDNTYK